MLSSTRSQRIGHDLVTEQQLFLKRVHDKVETMTVG